MQGYSVKQSSTAYPLVFLLIDSSDHISGKTGLSPTVTLSKAGGSFASPSGAVTEIANGWYKVAGNATDTGTLGPLILHATSTGADPSDALFSVVAYDDQDAVHFGLSALPNAAAAASGGLVINGTNAGTVTLAALTVTGATTHTGNVSLAAGLTITNSTTNGSAVTATGNGSGAGLEIHGGATGQGVYIVATAANGLYLQSGGANAAALI